MMSANSGKPVFYPSQMAREALATRFGLPFHYSMQDWEWEVADVKRFDEFFEAYRAEGVTDAERYSLMEILIQCVEEMPLSLFDSAWQRIELSLLARPEIHASTISYWACLEDIGPEAEFEVSRNMRRIWRMISDQM
ncbi:hypothetical protein WH265_14810 [Comamonas sp. MYb396]